MMPGARRFEDFIAQSGIAAIVMVGHDGKAIAWRHPDAADWPGTARIRLGLTQALHACPELQHETGLRT
jgi:hypothetical protein